MSAAITTVTELRRALAADRAWWRGLSEATRRRYAKRDPLITEEVGAVVVWILMFVGASVGHGRAARHVDDALLDELLRDRKRWRRGSTYFSRVMLRECRRKK